MLFNFVRDVSMTTRRSFVQSLPITGAAFCVATNVVLDRSPLVAQNAASAGGHFHPTGKSPCTHTKQIHLHSKKQLPFQDQRDLEEETTSS